MATAVWVLIGLVFLVVGAYAALSARPAPGRQLEILADPEFHPFPVPAPVGPDAAGSRAGRERAMRSGNVTPIRRARPICRHCRRRPAMTRIRGEWRVVKDHDVYRQCWRSWMDSIHAWKLAG